MHFGEIDIPKALIEAQRSGKLVIFAGAGVSQGPPSLLPGFDKLTGQIAAGAHVDRKPNEPFERYLGRLHRSGEGVDVHGIAKRIISDTKSKPTKLHHELLRLFPKASKIRIVTTNFDSHFSKAAMDAFDEPVPHYYAPALPLGHDFEGIIYLHGSIEQPKERLVLTDEDFGKAYLTDGWARRFLRQLFGRYFVLFVGYSHGDDIVNYLARGLPPGEEGNRFALDKGWTDPDEKGEKTDWEFLGVQPIYYPRAEGDNPYRLLPDVVARWSTFSRLSAAKHEIQIKELVSDPPTQDPEAEDLIRSALAQPTTARFYARHAQIPEWLWWANAQGFLDPLFSGGEMSEVDQILADWVARMYALKYPEETLLLIAQKHQQPNSYFWELLAQQLWTNKDDLDPETLAKWLLVLARSTPEHSDTLSFILRECKYPGDMEVALILFAELVRPVAEIQSSISFPIDDGKTRTRLEVKLRGDRGDLQEIWENVFKPNLEAFAGELEALLTDYLLRAHQYYRSIGKIYGPHSDPLSLVRSAIEPGHDQDEFPDEFDILINAARDLLEWLIQNRSEEGQWQIEKWSRSGCPILERLAIHGVSESHFLNANEKIQWLLDKGWIYARGLKHEVFRLLGFAFPDADQDTRILLLDTVGEKESNNGGDEEEAFYEDYKVFNLLHWLAQHDPACELTQKRLRAIREKHATFKPLEYPDLNSWSSKTSTGYDGPITVNQLLAKAAREWIDPILVYIGKEDDHYARGGVCESVGNAVRQNAEWGLELADALIERAEWTSELWRWIIYGFQETPLSTEQWEALLTLLKDHESLHEHASRIVSLLERRTHPNRKDLPKKLYAEAAELADELWGALASETEDPEVEDGELSLRLYNHPGANLALFYVYVLWDHRNDDGKVNKTIFISFKDRFKKIIMGESLTARAGQMILASRMRFLYELDEVWTKEHILDLFDWTRSATAQAAWTGFIMWGRVPTELLPELKERLKEAFLHLNDELSEISKDFSQRVADVALSGLIDPNEHDWLTVFFHEASVEDRVAWAAAVGMRLERFDSDAVQEAWNSWIRLYWQRRLDGKPLPLDPKEVHQMLGWMYGLSPVFVEAVDLMCKSPTPTFKHTRFFYKMAKSELVAEYPKATIRLLAHLLAAENEALKRQCRFVLQIIEALPLAGRQGVAFGQLVDRCIELGCLSAEGAQDLMTDSD